MKKLFRKLMECSIQKNNTNPLKNNPLFDIADIASSATTTPTTTYTFSIPFRAGLSSTEKKLLLQLVHHTSKGLSCLTTLKPFVRLGLSSVVVTLGPAEHPSLPTLGIVRKMGIAFVAETHPPTQLNKELWRLQDGILHGIALNGVLLKKFLLTSEFVPTTPSRESPRIICPASVTSTTYAEYGSGGDREAVKLDPPYDNIQTPTSNRGTTGGAATKKRKLSSSMMLTNTTSHLEESSNIGPTLPLSSESLREVVDELDRTCSLSPASTESTTSGPIPRHLMPWNDDFM